MIQTLLARIRDTSEQTVMCEAVTDPLWDEHGWALGARGVAAVIVAVLAGSVLLQLLG